VVKVTGGGAEFDIGRDGRQLLRIRIVAEVDGVRCDHEVTYGRNGETNAARGRAYARCDAPSGRRLTPRGSPP